VEHLTRRVVATTSSHPLAIIRLVLAFVILPHGLQKAFGLFGGFGFSGTMQYFTQTLGIPGPLAFMVFVAELAAPAALILGLWSRPAAVLIFINFVVAASMHVPNGFFMNWGGTMPAGAEGYEYHLLVLSMALAIIVGGAGSISLDRRLTRS